MERDEVVSKQKSVLIALKRYKQWIIIIVIVALNCYTYSVISQKGDIKSETYLLSVGGLCWKNVKSNYDISAFFTSAFLHSSLSHLLLNLFLFIVVAYRVSAYLGTFKMLTIYLFSCLTGEFLSCLVYAAMSQNVVTLGASNGVFGLGFTLVIVFFLNKKRRECIVSICALIILLIISLNGSDIMGHIGGIIGGIIGFIIFCMIPLNKIRRKGILRYFIYIFEVAFIIFAVSKIMINVNSSYEEYIYSGEEIGDKSQCIGAIDEGKYIIMQIDYINLSDEPASFSQKYNFKLQLDDKDLPEVSVLHDGYLPDTLVESKENKVIQICFQVEDDGTEFLFSLYSKSGYKVGDMIFSMQDVEFKSIEKIQKNK